MQPPDDPQCDSGGDSGDEEYSNPNKLSCHQLLVQSTIEIVDSEGAIVIEPVTPTKSNHSGHNQMIMVKISVETEKKQQPIIKPIEILSANCGRRKVLTKWRRRELNEDETRRKWRHEPPCLTSCNSAAFFF